MLLLDKKKIQQKVNRLAIEILEQNYKEKEIILAGINRNGLRFADLLERAIQQRSNIAIRRTQITLNPANPISSEVEIGLSSKELKNKVILIVDDVANTGRTIFYACKPLLDSLCKKIEVAVLVDRKHKSFPIKVDYVGMTLATTLQEHIEVNLNIKDNFSVYLKD